MEINKKQRRTLISVAVVIAAMMMYPPFYFPREAETTYRQLIPVRHEYGWLFGGYFGRVDVGLLLTQFLAVGVVGGIAYVLFAADKKG